MRNDFERPNGFPKGLSIIAGLIVGILVLLFIAHSIFGYWLEGVGSTEVGIQLHAGKPVAVVDSGNYTDWTPFASLQRVHTGNLDFRVSDPEVLTHDLQRISVSASGTVTRPGKTNPQVLLDNWGQYSTIYTNDELLVGRPQGTNGKDDPGKEGVMQDLGRQAIKVCIGDLDFSKAVVGSARDDVRDCVTKELNNLATQRGLTISNVVVPNVGLQPAVQQSLDAITKARFDQQVAEQQQQTAKANADNASAVASGQIRAEQAKVQEQARQDAITATLNQQALQAKNAVIQQEKANDLLASQQDLAINQARAAAAAESAKATVANESAVAKVYQDNPAYANQKAVEAQASAFKNTDKVIVPAGTNPNVILGNGTQQTVVQTPSR